MTKKIVKKNKMPGLKLKMPDGSRFVIDNAYHEKALKMKLKSEGISFEEFAPLFTKVVKRHWKNKTVPTKFDWDESWEDYFEDEGFGKKKFENMSELAEVVLYQYIRAFLLGIIFGEMSKGEGKVIALGEDDTIMEIDNKGFKKKKFSEWLKEAKKINNNAIAME